MSVEAGERQKLDIRGEALLAFFEEERKGPGPKRAQFNRACLKMVAQGFWNPGDRLPTDVEFTKILPLSIATVQASLKLLADQRIVVRRQRSGTTIASADQITQDLIFFRFTSLDGTRMAAVNNLKIEVTETSETGPWSDFLGPLPNYLMVTRTFEIDNAFKTLSKMYLGDSRLRILLDMPTDSLRNMAFRPMLQLRFGLPTVDLDWRAKIERFDQKTSAALDVAEGSLGQVFSVAMWTIGRTPLGYHRIWVPPNDREMVITGRL